MEINSRCFCIDRDTRSFESTNHQYGVYGDFENQFTIKLSQIDISENTKTTRVYDRPQNCLDVNHTEATCGVLPVYEPVIPTVCRIHTPSESHQTLHIQWTPSGQLPFPTTYYIELSDTNNLFNYDTFVMTNASTVNNSVTVSQLNSSITYDVRIMSYVRCSGLANKTYGLGCSNAIKANANQCPVPTSPPTIAPTSSPPTTVLSSPSSISLSPTTTSTLQSTSPTQASSKIIIISVSAGGVSMVLVVLVTIILLVTVRYKVFKKRNPSSPCVLPCSEGQVFVVYVPDTASEKDILRYIVCRLGEYFEVVTSGDRNRGDTVKWIEEQERKAKAVLLVFTKEFHQEWEVETKSHVVHAIRMLLSSAVVQQRLDKYAIVVLDEQSAASYIPNNHYLSSMTVFVLGKKRNQILDLGRFVEKKTRIVHRQEQSPSSSVECADDEKSLCTVSIDLTLSIDSEDSAHGLNHYLGKNNLSPQTAATSVPGGAPAATSATGGAPAATSATAAANRMSFTERESSADSESSTSLEPVVHQLLTILKADQDTASLHSHVVSLHN